MSYFARHWFEPSEYLSSPLIGSHWIYQIWIFFSCEYCDQRFHLLIDLKQHLKKHLNKSQVYESSSLVKEQQQEQQQQMEDDLQGSVDQEDDDNVEGMSHSYDSSSNGGDILSEGMLFMDLS